MATLSAIRRQYNERRRAYEEEYQREMQGIRNATTAITGIASIASMAAGNKKTEAEIAEFATSQGLIKTDEGTYVGTTDAHGDARTNPMFELTEAEVKAFKDTPASYEEDIREMIYKNVPESYSDPSVYGSEIRRQYRIDDPLQVKSDGIKGTLQRFLPGGETGYEDATDLHYREQTPEYIAAFEEHSKMSINPETGRGWGEPQIEKALHDYMFGKDETGLLTGDKKYSLTDNMYESMVGDAPDLKLDKLHSFKDADYSKKIDDEGNITREDDWERLAYDLNQTGLIGGEGVTAEGLKNILTEDTRRFLPENTDALVPEEGLKGRLQRFLPGGETGYKLSDAERVQNIMREFLAAGGDLDKLYFESQPEYKAGQIKAIEDFNAQQAVEQQLIDEFNEQERLGQIAYNKEQELKEAEEFEIAEKAYLDKASYEETLQYYGIDDRRDRFFKPQNLSDLAGADHPHSFQNTEYYKQNIAGGDRPATLEDYKALMENYRVNKQWREYRDSFRKFEKVPGFKGMMQRFFKGGASGYQEVPQGSDFPTEYDPTQIERDYDARQSFLKSTEEQLSKEFYPQPGGHPLESMYSATEYDFSDILLDNSIKGSGTGPLPGSTEWFNNMVTSRRIERQGIFDEADNLIDPGPGEEYNDGLDNQRYEREEYDDVRMYYLGDQSQIAGPEDDIFLERINGEAAWVTANEKALIAEHGDEAREYIYNVAKKRADDLGIDIPKAKDGKNMYWVAEAAAVVGAVMSVVGGISGAKAKKKKAVRERAHIKDVLLPQLKNRIDEEANRVTEKVDLFEDRRDAQLDAQQNVVANEMENLSMQKGNLIKQTKGLKTGSVTNLVEKASGDILDKFESMAENIGFDFKQNMVDLRQKTSDIMSDINMEIVNANKRYDDLAGSLSSWKNFWGG